ncbi:histidine phosphatase family protein [Ilumatobacter sp.]|uniref:histidine phosphatase family protein n=1 Tax=Ilumatobacter sp. TaxID=1967498 RepID=UPI003B519B71
MARLTLVRHGEAEAGWDDADDPGLSELGHRQAEAVAELLAAHGPLPILVSPKRRCRETAAPLAEVWSTQVTVDAAVGEVRHPDVADRGAWLRDLMAATWSDADADARAWADAVVERLVAIDVDTVVMSHFVAINVAIGRATGVDDVLCVRVGNCSRTVLDTGGGRLTLVVPPSADDDTTVL